MKSTVGRPKKHSAEHQKIHARCFLDIKRREPKVTQEIYAKDHGFSGRTLRRYIERYFPLEIIELKESELKEKKAKLSKNIIVTEKRDPEEPRIGLLVAWT